MQWVFSKKYSSSEAKDAAEGQRAPSTVGEVQRAVDKLRGYHDLAKEAIERAYALDVANDTGRAAKVYHTALDIAREGLALQVPSLGLEASHSTVSRLRGELHSWQQQVLLRLRDLEAPSPQARPTGYVPPNPLLLQSPKRSQSAGAGSQQQRQQQLSQQQPLAQQQAYGSPRAAGGAGPGARPGAASEGSREQAQFEERILSEVLDRTPAVRWEDVAGLGQAKQALQEMVILPSLRTDLFKGLRAPARGLLLYGPPGSGKTMLAKALAHEARATFFNISAASLTSRWHGDAEKLVRALFRVASRSQPAIIFIDEIDSVLSERTSTEHDASRRLKTEFLVQFDGVASSSDRVVVLGATNRPWELDDAVRRRLPKRIYIPLADAAGRAAIITQLLRDQRTSLTKADLARLITATEGYSGSDLAALCKEAAMLPIRELGPKALATITEDQLRPIGASDFAAALRTIRPSVAPKQLAQFDKWTAEFGV